MNDPSIPAHRSQPIDPSPSIPAHRSQPTDPNAPPKHVRLSSENRQYLAKWQGLMLGVRAWDESANAKLPLGVYEARVTVKGDLTVETRYGHSFTPPRRVGRFTHLGLASQECECVARLVGVRNISGGLGGDHPGGST